MRTRAAHPGHPHFVDPFAGRPVEQPLQRIDLLVGGDQRVELLAHEMVAPLAEAVEVEDEAADVAQLQLANAPKVGQPPPRTPPLAPAPNARLLRHRLGRARFRRARLPGVGPPVGGALE